MAINRDKILQEAQKLVEKKRFDKAILELQMLVAEDPSDVRTLLKIGDLHLKLEQHADAIAMYERVGQYYSAEGFLVKAVAVYKQIRDIIQKHVPHLEDRFGHIVPKLAELLTSLGLTSDALAYYDEMAARLQRVGRDRDAIDIVRKIVGLDTENPLAHLRLADALVRVRDLDGAVEEYAEASELLVKIGRQDDALRVVERILQHRQDAKYARLAAEIYLSRGKPNDAMVALQKVALCIKENPKDLEALALLARSFDQLGQPQKAIEVQKEAARIAREGSRVEVFDALMATLRTRAPNDEGVKALLAPREPAPASRMPPAQRSVAPPKASDPSPVPLSDSVEIIDEVDMEEVSREARAPIPPPPSSRGDQPIPLRASQPDIQHATPAQRVRQLLAQVESLRQRGDYHHAILTLQTAVSGMPSARDLREKLCDILIESGDQEQAIVEMLGFASYLSQTSDADGAARLLDEVLLLDPQNRDALTMLEQLGYSVAEEPAAEISYEAPEELPPDGYGSYPPPGGLPNVTGPFPSYQSAPPRAGSHPDPTGAGQYHESAPLPAFDLETDDSPRTHASRPPLAAPQAEQTGSRSFGVVELDDPFASEGGGYGSRASSYPQVPVVAPPIQASPIPAYAPPPPPPVVDDEDRTAYAPSPASYQRQPLPSFPISDEATSYGIAHDPAILHPSANRASDGQLDEAALEEIEFFQTHGMLEEAQSLLGEQLARLPNHPLLLERKRELEQLFGHTEAPEPSRTEASQVDRSFDIASALGGLDALEMQGPSPTGSTAGGPQQVSVETVFEQFKAGVAAQVADNDAATHYDLGVAYKEMGLFADSIAEFELASRDPTRECVSQSMIGMMHLGQGNIDQAIDAFLRGLVSPNKSVEQEIALTYEIGNAYELRKNLDQALYYFQLVSRLDPNYRDMRGSVEERISNLSPIPGAPLPARAAAGSEDEFDAAFDDLFDPKKPR